MNERAMVRRLLWEVQTSAADCSCRYRLTYDKAVPKEGHLLEWAQGKAAGFVDQHRGPWTKGARAEAWSMGLPILSGKESVLGDCRLPELVQKWAPCC